MKMRMLYTGALAAALLSGCKTFDRAVDVIDWTGGAISATADILRATAEDIGGVWGGVFGESEAPSPPPVE